jgi:uncharacterized protein involved in outer membrane biogenesis
LKVAGWTFAILLLLILCLAVTAAFLIRSPRVHACLIQTVQTKATAALNTPVHFRDFSFHLSGLNPSVDVYQLTVEGASPHRDTPLAQADQLHLEVTVASLLRRSWYVNNIRIEHPVVRVLVDREGTTNLPASEKSSATSSSTNIFDLGIRHLLIERGELYYNDRKSDLSADLRQLLFQSHFDLTGKHYYGNSLIEKATYNLAMPLRFHSLDANFSATPQNSSANTQLSAANRVSPVGEGNRLRQSQGGRRVQRRGGLRGGPLVSAQRKPPRRYAPAERQVFVCKPAESSHARSHRTEGQREQQCADVH